MLIPLELGVRVQRHISKRTLRALRTVCLLLSTWDIADLFPFRLHITSSLYLTLSLLTLRFLRPAQCPTATLTHSRPTHTDQPRSLGPSRYPPTRQTPYHRQHFHRNHWPIRRSGRKSTGIRCGPTRKFQDLGERGCRSTLEGLEEE